MQMQIMHRFGIPSVDSSERNPKWFAVDGLRDPLKSHLAYPLPFINI